MTISTDSVTKQYRGLQVLSDVDLEACSGRVTALLGPNGAGKSSLMRILLDLDRATSGVAHFGGCRYRDLAEPLRTVGATIEGGGAHPSRRGIDHLAWIAASNGIARHRVTDVLHQVGLTSAASKRIGKYSVGMRQRLAIATALLGDPAYFVLDEPGSGLDPDGIRWIRELMRTWAGEGRAVLVSSHLLAEVADLADDVVILVRGRVVAAGTTAEVVGNHRTLEEAYFELAGDK